MKIIAIALLLALLLALPSAPATATAPADETLAPLNGPPMNDDRWTQLLLGSWCASPSVGSAYNERWIFAEGALYVLPSQYDEGSEGVVNWSWSVRDGALLCGTLGYSKSFALDGPYQVADDESPYSPKIQIDGRTFYQYAPDPAYFPDLADYGLTIESSVGSPKADDGATDQLDELATPTPEPGALFGPEVTNIEACFLDSAAQYARVGR